MTEQTVVNLSDFILTDDQTSILLKGLKFCPSPNFPDPGELREDMDNLHRRVRQIAFFESEDSISPDDSSTPPTQSQNLNSSEPFKHRKFKLKSTGRGPAAPNTVELMVKSNEIDLLKNHTFNMKQQNISPKEREAMKELSRNTDIIIKPADKGGAIVILNRNDYLREGYTQLSNRNFYQEIPEDLTEQNRVLVQNAIEDMYQNGEIDISVKNYLTDIHCKTPNFYLLPKIHKGITPPPGRPILSANGSPTEKISQFVDHFLSPLCPQIPSYVKDSTHFLQIIDALDHLPNQVYLVTMDVTSLYTNIPVQEGLDAIKDLLEQERRFLDSKPTNETLLELLKLVLTKNNFQFNGKHYLQIKGVSMGSKVSPSFAILYMHNFESKYVYTYHKRPLIYLRYIDDIFMIWPHSLEDLNTFIEYINSQETNIKFSTEISDKSVSFLDMQVSIQDNHITTDLYTKPTDAHDYLLYSSAHPQKCKDSIPYSQFLRIKRICSNPIDFDRNVLQMSKHFHRRGYPIELLESAALKVKRIDRKDLLTPKEPTPKSDPNQVFLITRYNPNDDSLRTIVQNNWDILGTSSTTSHIHQRKLLTGYRRPKNLRDILVKAQVSFKEGDEKNNPLHIPLAIPTPTPTSVQNPDLRQTTLDKFLRPLATPCTHTVPPPVLKKHLGTSTKERGFSFCNTQLCKYCKLLDKSGNIISHYTHEHHHCMKNISCRSSNVIYCLTCNNCGKQYVGQTLRRIKDRLYEHLRDIDTLNKDKPLGVHFSQSCQANPSIKVHILEFIKKPPRSPEALIIRNRIEKRWIHLLRTPVPLGLNLED